MPDFKKNTTPAMKKTMAYSKADPTAFKMRSGNGPLAFKEMGATPAKFDFGSLTEGFLGNNDIKTDSSGKKLYGEGKGVFKDDTTETKKFDTNMKDFPIGSKERTEEYDKRDWKHDDTTKPKEELTKIEPKAIEPLETKMEEPELAKAEMPDDTASKPEKEGNWFQRGWKKFQDHHDSGKAREIEAHFKDAAAVVAGDGRPGGDALRAQIAKDKKSKQDYDLKTSEIAKRDAKDEIKETRESEMHKSRLAVNAQNIAASKALEKQRLSKIDVQKEADNEEKVLNESEPTAPDIIKGTGTAESVIGQG